MQCFYITWTPEILCHLALTKLLVTFRTLKVSHPFPSPLFCYVCRACQSGMLPKAPPNRKSGSDGESFTCIKAGMIYFHSAWWFSVFPECLVAWRSVHHELKGVFTSLSFVTSGLGRIQLSSTWTCMLIDHSYGKTLSYHLQLWWSWGDLVCCETRRNRYEFIKSVSHQLLHWTFSLTNFNNFFYFA